MCYDSSGDYLFVGFSDGRVGVYTTDGSFLFSQCIVPTTEQNQSFCALNWLGSSESGMIVVATVRNEVIVITGLNLPLLRRSLQEDDTQTILRERDNMNVLKYDFSSFFSRIACMAVVGDSSSSFC